VAAGTPATHPVAGTLSRNPECDIDARGPTSCRRSRLRAHQESGNRCALTMAPAWTLTLDYPQYRHHTLVVAPRRILLHVLVIPVGNCGSPIGVRAGRCPCGGRKCGVDLSVENVDRPRPDQQRRSILPAGVPSTSSTGHPRGACRDKAQRRGSASGHDSRVLDAETERHGALCTPGNPITCAVRTPPQAPRGGVHLFFPSAIPHRYSTVAHLDLAAIRPLPLTSGDRRPTGAIGDRLVGCSPPSGSAPGAPPEGEARTRLEVVADKLAPSRRWATADHPDRDEVERGWSPAGTGWSPGAADR
jgi:hypothetical protein